MSQNKGWQTEELRGLLQQLQLGVTLSQGFIYISKNTKGRFVEEENFKIEFANDEQSQYLLTIKVFWGRPPYYRPWVELFSIKRFVVISNTSIMFFGSPIEKWLIIGLSNKLPSGSSLFVEYINDDYTTNEIVAGVPPPFTRLGYIMLGSGLTWFKDWYYSEGLREGNIKLQGQKALTEDDFARQMKEITKTARYILERCPDTKVWQLPKKRASEWLAGF